MQTPDFAKMVPGFDFLQGLLKNAGAGAGAGLPGLGQWVAPTLDPDEIDKRIGDLRTVQYWLEQNARLLGTTIQALEVQRMTLATLKSMNMPVGDLRRALEARPPAQPEVSAPPAAASPGRARTSRPTAQAAGADAAGAGAPAAADAAPPAVDPMQWWGALTRQFGELASQALQEGSPARTLADAMVKAPAQALAKAAASTAPPAAAKAARAKAARAPRAAKGR